MADANSCCCGATKSNPCACMKKMAKTGGKMQCSSKEPMCACYKDKAKIKKAFDTGWTISKKSWDDMDEDEDSGWTDNPMECRVCGHILSGKEWEGKRCPQCGTRNTVHPMYR